MIMSKKQPPEVFYENSVPNKFTRFTGKHLYQSLFLNKAADLRPFGNFFNFAKFFEEHLF